jgi:hypothetical protein
MSARVVLTSFAILALSALVTAQHEGHQMAPVRPQVKTERLPDLGWEPIRCWRQSTAGAVTIGETFSVVVTCAVYEGDNAQVVPDESRLGVASIQMAPFEILGGAHPPDVHRGTRRFFQYDYQLRIISADAIGHDVNIPPLSISYRIHSRVGAAATLEGRDLSYVMPMMPIKVLSLVPVDASDIRDASEASLANVDALRFRSSVFAVLTATFGALAVAMVVLALVPLARSKRAAGPDERDRVPVRAILARASEELADAQARAARDGWNDDAIARALLSARLIAAAAVDQPISQKRADSNGAPVEGRLIVRHGVFRPAMRSVSSSTTADDVRRAREAGSQRLSTTRQQQLEGLQAGLTTLTAALYPREPVRDASALDDAARQALTIARDLQHERRAWKTWAQR